MVALAAVLVWQGRDRFLGPPAPKALDLPKDPILIGSSPTMGSASARFAMVQYSEFQCPFCGTVARDTIPILIQDYVDTGKLLLVFKNLPLPIHPLAPAAAAGAVCAHQQDKFWPMHDKLFTEPMQLETQQLRASAEHVGLDLTRYDACLADPQTMARVESDKAEADALRISGTPTFLFGKIEAPGQIRVSDAMSGAKPVTQFKAIIDRLIQ